MSMSLALADQFIAKVIGGQNDTNKKAQARHALGSAMEDFQIANDWSFLIVDTSQSFTVVSSASGTTTNLTTAVSNGFQNVLVGMAVTHANIPAGTTVSAKAADNLSLTLSQATTGGISAADVTFGGTIPIIAGTDSYTLPSTFWKPMSCRLISNTQTLLKYVTPRELDMLTYDPTTQGAISYYTIYSGAIFDASGTQQQKIKFARVPMAADVALLKYYRPFNLAADPVDIPDEYLYSLLMRARFLLLLTENANDERLGAYKMISEQRLKALVGKDRNEGGEDEFERLHTPGEMLATRGDPLWPRGDYGAGMPDGIM